MTDIVAFVVAGLLRPEFTPVGAADVELALRRERELGSQVSPVGRPAKTWQDVVPGRFVVGFADGQGEMAAGWVRRHRGRVVRTDGLAGFLVAEFDGGTAPSDADARAGGLRYAEPDCRARVARIPNDPMYLPSQWDKYVMYADRAWDFVTGGTVKVAVVDNGVDYLHSDLAANFRQGELGYDFVGNDYDPRPDNPGVAEAFHGTHVAGIIAAAMDNGLGIAGWAQAQLLAVRCLNDTGSGNTSDVAAGVRWAADHGAKVINMSLGANTAPQHLVDACAYAAAQGALLVAASGNEGTGSINYPAALSECVAVGALARDSRLASFSNYGAEQELVAPGVEVLSTMPGGGYEEQDGTSMATPEVSGVAVLLFAASGGMTAGRARSILGASAVDMGQTGWDSRFGFGLVNAGRALDMVRLLERRGSAPMWTRSGPGTLRGRAGALPEWGEQVMAFDGLGRRVAVGDAVEELGSGAWFVRFEAGSRVEVVRLLVVR